MNQTISLSTSSTPYVSADKPCLPRKEQAVALSQKADSFEAQQMTAKNPAKKQPKKQSASYAWLIGGGVLLVGLAILAFFQREALASTWEKLFKKSTTEPPKPPVVPQKPATEPPKPSVPANPPHIPPVNLMTEALQTQLDALPTGLKPDVTAYDLTDTDQFSELRIYVQGLHELREQQASKTLCEAIDKICYSIGSNANDCAWMSRAQARRLAGTIENGRPIGKDIHQTLPEVIFDSLLPENYHELSNSMQRSLRNVGEIPFQEAFGLEDRLLGTTVLESTSTGGSKEIGRSFNQIESSLRAEPSGSLFYLTHNVQEGEVHAGLLANIRGHIYYIDNNMTGTTAQPLQALFDEKITSANKKRIDLNNDTIIPRPLTTWLKIRKFKDLKIHSWLLNETP
jgi:hypothetical protein